MSPEGHRMSVASVLLWDQPCYGAAATATTSRPAPREEPHDARAAAVPGGRWRRVAGRPRGRASPCRGATSMPARGCGSATSTPWCSEDPACPISSASIRATSSPSATTPRPRALGPGARAGRRAPPRAPHPAPQRHRSHRPPGDRPTPTRAPTRAPTRWPRSTPTTRSRSWPMTPAARAPSGVGAPAGVVAGQRCEGHRDRSARPSEPRSAATGAASCTSSSARGPCRRAPGWTTSTTTSIPWTRWATPRTPPCPPTGTRTHFARALGPRRTPPGRRPRPARPSPQPVRPRRAAGAARTPSQPAMAGTPRTSTAPSG